MTPWRQPRHAEPYEERGELDKYLAEVVIPGLLLAQNDKDRKVLTPDREVAVVTTYSELLEELWPGAATDADAASPVLVVSAHGALNFAAALSFSALLRYKNVPHRLLPEDAVQPGKFPEELAEGGGIVCLCYLIAPSPAKYAYLERRLAARLPEARIIGVAWKDNDGANAVLKPEHALALLPSAPSAKPAEEPQSPV